MHQQKDGAEMRAAVAVCFALLVAGCEPVDSYIASAVGKAQKVHRDEEIKKLQGELESQAEELTSLRSAVEDLRTKTSLHAAQLDGIDEIEAVVREGGGYGIAKTKQGVFVVSIEKLEPYLDGYKATLHIGNPGSMTMLGGDFIVKWGLPWNTPNKKINEVWATRKSKKFSFAQSFPGGGYTAVEVALTPAKPEEVKELNVVLGWNRISLRSPTTSK